MLNLTPWCNHCGLGLTPIVYHFGVGIQRCLSGNVCVHHAGNSLGMHTWFTYGFDGQPVDLFCIAGCFRNKNFAKEAKSQFWRMNISKSACWNKSVNSCHSNSTKIRFENWLTDGITPFLCSGEMTEESWVGFNFNQPLVQLGLIEMLDRTYLDSRADSINSHPGPPVCCSNDNYHTVVL